MRSDRATRVLLVVVATLLLLNLLPNATGLRGAGIVQYKYVQVAAKTPEQAEALLNQLGAQGWELIQLSVLFNVNGPNYSLFIKK